MTDIRMKLEEIVLIYGSRLLDVKNGKENPTFGELVDEPVQALTDLIQETMLELIKRQPTWESSTMIDAEVLIEEIEKL